MRRLGWFVIGVVVTLVVLFVGAYLFIRAGGISMATTAAPLPLEKTIAKLALRSSYGSAQDQHNPLPVTEANIVAGAEVYHQQCITCHGAPGVSRSAIAKGMFPVPPQLFAADDMVTDDPEGITYWKVTHGIRLSGMPGFSGVLSDTQRWQVTMLVAHADKLPPAATRALTE